MSPNREARTKKYSTTDETSRDYYSGNTSHFKIKSKPISDPLLSSRLEGPKMKSQQWERTAK